MRGAFNMGQTAVRGAFAAATALLLASCGKETGPSVSTATMAGEWSYEISNVTSPGGAEVCDVTSMKLLFLPDSDGPGEFTGSLVTIGSGKVICTNEGGAPDTVEFTGSHLTTGEHQTGSAVQFFAPNPFSPSFPWENNGTIADDGGTMSGTVTFHLDDPEDYLGAWTAVRQ